jgi:hypothetical protein
VLVEPPAVDLGDAIEGCNVVGGEETGADVANQTANSVDGEDVKSIIDSQEELELGRVVGE